MIHNITEFVGGVILEYALAYVMKNLFISNVKLKTPRIFCIISIISLLPFLRKIVPIEAPGEIKILTLIASSLIQIACFKSIFKTHTPSIIYILSLSFCTTRIWEAILNITFFITLKQYVSAYLLHGLTLILLLYYTRKNDYFEHISDNIMLIPKKIYAGILGFSFVLGLFLWLVVSQVDLIVDKRILTALLLILIIVGFTFILFSIMKISIDIRLERIKQQTENEIKYYKKINSIYKELRAIRHDLKNHIICLKSLIEEKEFEKAVDYINNIAEMSVIEKNIYNTGNIIIDALLNDKVEKASLSRTKIIFEGSALNSILNDSDYCIILSNAIDNAIEACARDTTNVEKVVEIKSYYCQGYYFLTIINPIFEKLQVKKNNKLLTSKKDKSDHGYGISNITQTVKKYNGKVEISHSDKNFTLNIELQLNYNPIFNTI